LWLANVIAGLHHTAKGGAGAAPAAASYIGLGCVLMQEGKVVVYSSR
jgi:hypothetical protein